MIAILRATAHGRKLTPVSLCSANSLAQNLPQISDQFKRAICPLIGVAKFSPKLCLQTAE